MWTSRGTGAQVHSHLSKTLTLTTEGDEEEEVEDNE